MPPDRHGETQEHLYAVALDRRHTGVIIGKATLNGVGNHTFRATVIDNGEPGGNDRFGLR